MRLNKALPPHMLQTVRERFGSAGQAVASGHLRHRDRDPPAERIIAATSESSFGSSWLGALNESEIGAAGPFHAEMNPVAAARAMGWESLEVPASRPIYAGCQLGLNAEGVSRSRALKSYPAWGWFADAVFGDGGRDVVVSEIRSRPRPGAVA